MSAFVQSPNLRGVAAPCNRQSEHKATVPGHVANHLNSFQPSRPWALSKPFTASVTSKRAPSRSTTPFVTHAAAANSSVYSTLEEYTVVRINDGEVVRLSSLVDTAPGSKSVVVFLTHFADLSSWELAQKIVKKLPLLQAAGVQVSLVGLGAPDNAQRFSETLSVPLALLYSDDTGAPYRALGFSQGFAPDAGVDPYLKLLPMLAGIGSPGTLQEVIRGYVGDRDAKPVFDQSSPFDILGTGYQRPFELATLRLFNMAGILPKWQELCPADTKLLTQQGGAFGFVGGEVVYRHDDSGILKYCEVDALVAAVTAAAIPDAATKV